MHPLNAILRFCLEIAMLFSYGYWGWHQFDHFLRWLFTLGLPIVAATLWGVFRIPGDTSASGEAVVPVPGWVRLFLELGLFVFAAICLFTSGKTTLAIIFSSATVIHYLSTYSRIRWMLGQ